MAKRRSCPRFYALFTPPVCNSLPIKLFIGRDKIWSTVSIYPQLVKECGDCIMLPVTDYSTFWVSGPGVCKRDYNVIIAPYFNEWKIRLKFITKILVDMIKWNFLRRRWYAGSGGNVALVADISNFLLEFRVEPPGILTDADCFSEVECVALWMRFPGFPHGVVAAVVIFRRGRKWLVLLVQQAVVFGWGEANFRRWMLEYSYIFVGQAFYY